MKLRSDFVTNSSSSSFIISKNHVSRDKLQEILLEIANREGWSDEPYTWEDDVTDDTVAYRYHIREATPEHPYNEDYYHRDKKIYDNHFIIHNHDCGRYNFFIVDKVLGEHNIPWTYGYCD